MELLAAFLAGWVLGAGATPERRAELVRAWRALRDTEEFTTLAVTVRAHVASGLRSLADLIDGGTSAEPEDLVARVRALFERG